MSFSEKSVQVQTESIKCSSCGSNMVFDPDSQKLICNHCGSKQNFDDFGVAEEQDILSGFEIENNWDNDSVVVFKCDNCGAKVVLKDGETAASCPFCGTAHVKKIEELAGVKPNGLLSFSFGVDKASNFAKIWAKKRIFAPRKFKKSISTQNVKGVYAPCFTFDSITTSIYCGRIGKRKYKTVGSGKNRKTVSYVVWRNISGTFYNNFDDLLITAGSKLDQQKIDKLYPFDTNSSKKYDENYLLGFMAYHYDKDIEDCWKQAKTRMDEMLRNSILSQYSYDEVAYLNVSTTHEKVTYKYVMLPVYVGNYSFNKKLFNFYVNGTTGKVFGKTPISVLKVLLTVLSGVALAVLIGLLIYFNG